MEFIAKLLKKKKKKKVKSTGKGGAPRGCNAPGADGKRRT